MTSRIVLANQNSYDIEPDKHQIFFLVVKTLTVETVISFCIGYEVTNYAMFIKQQGYVKTTVFITFKQCLLMKAN